MAPKRIQQAAGAKPGGGGKMQKRAPPETLAEYREATGKPQATQATFDRVLQGRAYDRKKAAVRSVECIGIWAVREFMWPMPYWTLSAAPPVKLSVFWFRLSSHSLRGCAAGRKAADCGGRGRIARTGQASGAPLMKSILWPCWTATAHAGGQNRM